MILPISTSHVARITGISYQHKVLKGIKYTQSSWIGKYFFQATVEFEELSVSLSLSLSLSLFYIQLFHFMKITFIPWYPWRIESRTLGIPKPRDAQVP
jgi:hypothetical protein